MDNRNSIVDKHNEKRQKYVYYVLALAAASIAFAVNITINQKLNNTMIVLGLAVLSWMISIYSGLKSLRYDMEYDVMNVNLLDAISGKHKDLGTHPQKIAIGVDVIGGAMNATNTKITSFNKLQNWSLYIGTVLFIIWRILMMM